MFLVWFSSAPSPSPEERVHADVSVKGGGADNGRITGTPVNLKDPLRCGWKLIHNLKLRVKKQYDGVTLTEEVMYIVIKRKEREEGKDGERRRGRKREAERERK